MTKTAVILAAGFGSRLHGIWFGEPKGLIPVGGVSLLDRSFAILKENGIERIVIGTGHKAEAFEMMKTRYPEIETIYSHDYATTSSFATLSKMSGILNEDVLVLESDLLYDRRAIEFLLKHEEKNVVLSSDITDLGDEVFLEVNEDQHLVNLSKDPKQLKKIHSVLVGINKLSASYLRGLFDHSAELLAQNQKMDYEKAFASHHGKEPIKVIAMDNLAWTEIDTPEHYEYAVKSVLPRLENVYAYQA